MSTFNLTISSPDGNIFEGEAVKISVRGIEGDLAVMAGHIPFITAVKECECRIELPDGTEKNGHTAGGLLNVSDNNVILLSDTFSW
ncbi:MAG: F0F1 ATP synthase subunit epsilon [Ruminococcus sp.]|nr:F0F1 ATP synthase subunit epsilon [Ruminococcus sp.]